MKFVKFSIFALSLGLFVASCGDSANEETTTEDTTMMTAPVEPAPAPMDTMMAAPADSMSTSTTTTTTTDSTTMAK